jgi:hypothetical protein
MPRRDLSLSRFDRAAGRHPIAPIRSRAASSHCLTLTSGVPRANDLCLSSQRHHGGGRTHLNGRKIAAVKTEQPRKASMTRSVLLAPLCAILALGGCAVPPPVGPTVMALPGKGKDFAAFQQDDIACRQYASAQIGYGSPAQAATQSAVGSAVLGTALGAAAGAAIGAAAGNPAAGAAIGAGSGLVMGSAVGAGAAAASGGAVQQRYDIGYAQCMVARGDTIQPPPTAAAGYGYPYPYSPYAYPAYPAPYYYPGYYYGPYPAYYGAPYASSIAIGIGTWGWGGGWHGGWYGQGWHGGWHGGGGNNGWWRH